LKKHVGTVHEKVKPYICEWEGCGRSFGFKKVLDRHLLTHTQPGRPRERKKTPKELDLFDQLAGGESEEERKIGCSVEGCDYRFFREYDLRRHLAAMHQDIQIPE
jgi:general transcription factor IIIA